MFFFYFVGPNSSFDDHCDPILFSKPNISSNYFRLDPHCHIFLCSKKFKPSFYNLCLISFEKPLLTILIILFFYFSKRDSYDDAHHFLLLYIQVLIKFFIIFAFYTIKHLTPLSLGNNYFENITNLTSHDLILKIMQNLFIHDLYISCIDIMHWKHIWHIFVGICEICATFIHSFIFYSLTHLYICQTCFEHMIFMCEMYTPMNEWTSHGFHY